MDLFNISKKKLEVKNDKLSDFIELYIFNKTEHINLFRTLKELKLLFPIIRELEDYSEDVNLYEKEIEQLIEEIEKIQKNDSLKNNYFLASLYISAKKALDKDLEERLKESIANFKKSFN